MRLRGFHAASTRRGDRRVERRLALQPRHLATSDDVPGLVAQVRTVTETLEIARDVGRRLLEEQGKESNELSLPTPGEAFDYPLVIAA